MRKIGLILGFLLSSFMLLSQEGDTTGVEYPKPYVVDGDTIGAILTIDQLNKIDKDDQLLKMYKDLLSSYEETDDFCISIVDDYEEQITSYEVKVGELKKNLKDKDIVISKLREKVALYEENEGSYEEKLNNKDEIINEKDEVIDGMKKKMLWGGIGAGLTVILVIILAIL
jgi:predicted RNase H-like nuclease (RuvC/YqgF family)